MPYTVGMKRTPLKRGTPLRTTKGLTRSSGPLRKTKMRALNATRQAKRAKQYRTVIASDFHKRLRYAAFERSGGLCECAQCKDIRQGTAIHAGPVVEVAQAFVPIPCWFTVRGKKPWQRFRSNDGELHHTSYRLYGDENPDELRLVQWVWKDCHRRIEAEHGTRRRFLSHSK